jgi:DNA mismatch endonuclease (patch repair protein)
MAAIGSKETEPERILASEMWKIGLRPVKHKAITGRPDFLFPREKVAVFCDGDFWHGNNWRLRGFRSRREELASYTPFWRQKILTNIRRDKRVSTTLRLQGYVVLRFWESVIRKNACIVAKKIKTARDARRRTLRRDKIEQKKGK